MSLGSSSAAFFGAAGAAGAAGYEIERSLRFNSADSAYLNRTPASAGNRKTWTWAGWVKRGTLDEGSLFTATTSTSGGSNITRIQLRTTNDGYIYVLNVAGNTSDIICITTAAFRDPSAWYHIVVSVDTTQASVTDGVRIWVNGVRFDELSFNTYTQNATTFVNNTNFHFIGANYNLSSGFFDGYLADVHFIDGSALDPTSFGEFDANDVWQPIAYTGTYGTNGFHLDFADNSSAAALGYDAAGSNDWTVNNISGPFYSGTALFNASLNATPFSDATGNETITNNGSITTSAAGTNSFNISNAGDFGSFGQWLAVTTVTIPTNYTIDYYYKSTNATQVGNATVIDSNGEVFIRDYGSATSRSLRLNDGSATDYSYTITNNTWNHVRVTNTGIWVNGTSINSSPKNIAGRSAGITIGNYNNSDGYEFDGLIGPVRILDADLGAPTAGGEPTDSGSLPNTEPTSSPSGADNDSLRDSPTNGDTANDTGLGGELAGNYATLNPLNRSTSNIQTSNGNLDFSTVSTTYREVILATQELTQKTYWEMTLPSVGVLDYTMLGIVDLDQYLDNAFSNGGISPNTNLYNYGSNCTGWRMTNGDFYNGSSNVFTSTVPTLGDTLGMAFDPSTGGIYLWVNGVAQNSGNAVTTVPVGKTYIPAFLEVYTGQTSTVNFGQRPFANTNVPSGYKALCTANLDTPLIEDGSTAIDVVLYDGNNSTQTISGLNFSPDLVWLKSRSNGDDHSLQDTVRGAGNNRLRTNQPNEENTQSGQISSFNSDGWTMGNRTNESGRTYVGWAWDGGSSTGTNNDGTISAQVRANPSTGFSIVSYTSTNTDNATVGHGLGVAPQMIIIKNRDAAENWFVLHEAMDNANPWSNYSLFLNTTDARSGSYGTCNGTAPTSSVITLSNVTNPAPNYGTDDKIMYCFASVEGYSAFGSYKGNGNADGPFVYTGFRPAFVLTKCTTIGPTDWMLFDYKRPEYNVTTGDLRPNLNNAESSTNFDIVSNGFKLRNSTGSQNFAARTYIYAAFAENPFKIARAR